MLLWTASDRETTFENICVGDIFDYNNVLYQKVYALVGYEAFNISERRANFMSADTKVRALSYFQHS